MIKSKTRTGQFKIVIEDKNIKYEEVYNRKHLSDKSDKEIKNYFKVIIDYYYNTLRTNETKRKLVSVYSQVRVVYKTVTRTKYLKIK